MLPKKNHNLRSDQSNACNDSKEPAIDFACGGSCRSVWTNSRLLNENLFPDSSLTSKKKAVKKSLKQELQLSSRYCFQEVPLSELVGTEEEELSFNHSTRSVKQKSTICGASKSTSFAEPSHRGRRLLKKNVTRMDILESVISDSVQECSLNRTNAQYNNITTAFNYPDGVGNEDICINNGTTPDGVFSDLGGNRNDDSEDVEEIKDLNYSFPSRGLILSNEDAQADLERTSKAGCSDVEENLHGEIKEGGQIEHTTRLPASTKLSCVICWTDFSSTRGVLPCGHRFCYSCIQNWADHMASRRKISTCPLCKASFLSITKVDDAATTDQKIYSQTIPFAPSVTDVFFLPDHETPSLGAQSSLAEVCSECRSREPEDLLISCHLCQIRRIHSYCLEPLLLPWTCMHCKDLRMRYHHYR